MAVEHWIRLRGAWTCHGLGPDADPGRRVDLPTQGPPDRDRPFRMNRPFGRPRLDPLRESLTIRLEGVGGLRLVRLNGRVVAEPTAGTEALELPLPEPLPARNVLELEVDPAGRLGPAPGDARWGCVALVVRRT